MNDKKYDDKYYDFIDNYLTRKNLKNKSHVKTAYNLFYDSSLTPDRREKILKAAYIMCRYMRPDTEDIVIVFLMRLEYFLRLNGKTYSDKIIDTFGKEAGTRYWDMVNKINTEVGRVSDKETSSAQLVMMNVCDKMYRELIEIMNTGNDTSTRVPGEEIVKAAYDFAREVHAQVPPRQSGEPYLAHPLNVARILAKLQVECDVIAAALLHDVVEDGKPPVGETRPATEYFLSEIERICNPRVRALVDAVTSRDREYEESDNQEKYSRDKAATDSATVNKLRKIVENDSDMIPALYIKAADRIHNLATIDVMEVEKQRKKVDETEKDYLPLFNDYGLKYFCDKIRDYIFKINRSDLYTELDEAYHKMVTSGPDVLHRLKKKITTLINDELNEFNNEVIEADQDDNPPKLTATVYGRSIHPLELSVMLKDEFKTARINATMVDKKVLPIGRLDIIIDDIVLRETEENDTLDKFLSPFIRYFINSDVFSEYAIIDIVRPNRYKMLLTLEDNRRNMYRLNFMTRSYYMQYLFGSEKGFYKELDYTEEFEDGTITVFLRDGKEKTLKKGSTVIDCAFAIHSDIGLCLRAATVDGKPATISNRLYDGAKVVVEHGAKRKDGVLTEFHPTARLSWLFNVKTDNAKKRLIDYFSRKYGEGDNPLSESKCRDKIAENAAAKLMAALAKEDVL